jgi:hypothetical protein
MWMSSRSWWSTLPTARRSTVIDALCYDQETGNDTAALAALGVRPVIVLSRDLWSIMPSVYSGLALDIDSGNAMDLSLVLYVTGCVDMELQGDNCPEPCHG